MKALAIVLGIVTIGLSALLIWIVKGFLDGMGRGFGYK